jgi:ABC-2 type transport system permease protein
MTRLFAIAHKEMLLLLRDPHALALLFVMPAVFIIIMSLALQDRFAAHSEVRIDYLWFDADHSEISAQMLERLQAASTLRRIDDNAPLAQLEQRVGNDKAQVHDFGDRLLSPTPQAMTLHFAPGCDASVKKLVEAQLKDIIARIYVKHYMQALSKELPDWDESFAVDLAAVDATLTSRVHYRNENKGRLPTSVQQNVPAWLLFAMFFIAVPLSTTLVTERAQGTLLRLRALNVPMSLQLAGKLLPYFCISLLQVVLMLLLGMFVVPLLGGDALVLGDSVLALVAISASSAFAATGFGLLVAALVKSAAQATTFTGVCNIVMAALGGIMVPRFVMPPTMQDIGLLSPLAWGLEGFLDVLLRQGDCIAILPEASALIAFGFATSAIAVWRLRKDG